MKKIRRKCKCGCGEITNSGRVYIYNHHLRGKKHSVETIKKISESKKGKKFSEEHKLNLSLARIKYDPDNSYCDVWKDREYRKDIRKDYCENVDCKKD